jgi:predicted DNA-binding protein (MmcQ/YjbR family)
VRDRPFVIMGEYEGRTSMHFKLLHETQDYLVQSGRFERSGYIGQHGWTALPPGAEVDWDEIADLIDEGYRRAAPRTLIKKIDE